MFETQAVCLAVCGLSVAVFGLCLAVFGLGGRTIGLSCGRVVLSLLLSDLFSVPFVFELCLGAPGLCLGVFGLCLGLACVWLCLACVVRMQRRCIIFYNGRF